MGAESTKKTLLGGFNSCSRKRSASSAAGQLAGAAIFVVLRLRHSLPLLGPPACEIDALATASRLGHEGADEAGGHLRAFRRHDRLVLKGGPSPRAGETQVGQRDARGPIHRGL